jgi:hypothetical protein
MSDWPNERPALQRIATFGKRPFQLRGLPQRDFAIKIKVKIVVI